MKTFLRRSTVGTKILWILKILFEINNENFEFRSHVFKRGPLIVRKEAVINKEGGEEGVIRVAEQGRGESIFDNG